MSLVQMAHGQQIVFNHHGEATINCPFCETKGHTPDTKQKLGINAYKGIYNCFRCQTSGRVTDTTELTLLTGMGNAEPEDDFDEYEAMRSRVTNLFDMKAPEPLDLSKLSMTLSKNETPIAYHYMKTRGFSDSEMSRYKLCVGKTVDLEDGRQLKRWVGRVLFPFVWEDSCEYMVGRSYTGAEPKYLNSRGSRSYLVYNLNNVTDGVCIICEGIISAIAAERVTRIPAVATLGKQITRNQVSRIRSKCEKVFLSLDGDVSEDLVNQTAKSLMRSGLEVWKVSLPVGEDPDDLKDNYKEYFTKATKLVYY